MGVKKIVTVFYLKVDDTQGGGDKYVDDRDVLFSPGRSLMTHLTWMKR